MEGDGAAWDGVDRGARAESRSRSMLDFLELSFPLTSETDFLFKSEDGCMSHRTHEVSFWIEWVLLYEEDHLFSPGPETTLIALSTCFLHSR